MPITPTYPGVYIEELPSGVRTIVGVATSIAAFVDFFSRGPLNRAVQIFNMGDFERQFGGLDRRSEASYAIQQFFQNGGTEAWVIRTAAGSYATADVVLTDTSGSDALQVTAGRLYRGNLVDNPGLWGNQLRLDVDYNTSDPNTLFNLTVSEVVIRNGRRIVLQSETFRNLSMATGANYAIDVVNEGSALIYLTALGANRPAQTGTVGVPLGVVPVLADGDQIAIGFPGGSRDATLRFSSPLTDLPQVRAALERAIRAAGSQAPPEPLLAGAMVQLIGNRLRILAGGRTSSEFDPSTVLTVSEVGGGSTAAALGLTGAGVVAQVQQYAVGSGTAGSDGSLPGGTELRGIRDPDKSGIYALEDVDIFNILCLPRAAELSDANERQAVLSEAITYCEEQRAFLIVDIPATIDTVQEAKDWLEQNATLRHPNAAVYFPRPRIADPLNDYRLRSVGASGTMAGLYARIDSDRGVWKAPAGIEASLRNVQELDYKLTDPENGTLNPLGINCLRNFPIYGNVSWGARTLMGSDQQASEWKYIPVRRLALFIEESLYRGTQWAVFEPNDEPLWAQLRLNIGAFMQNLFRKGAFQGKTPKEAYLVKCDRETTTQTDIDLGIVNVLVGFAPLKPAEFVIIQIQQLAGQVQT